MDVLDGQIARAERLYREHAERLLRMGKLWTVHLQELFDQKEALKMRRKHRFFARRRVH